MLTERLDQLENLPDLDTSDDAPVTDAFQEVTVQKEKIDLFARSDNDSAERTELLNLRDGYLQAERNNRKVIEQLDAQVKELQQKLRNTRTLLADNEQRRDSVERQLVRVRRIANGERVVGRKPRVESSKTMLAWLRALPQEELEKLLNGLAEQEGGK